MKTDIDLNKIAIISHFLDNYKKFEWKLQDNAVYSYLTTHINNYRYRLASNNEVCYFQAIRDGEYLCTSINSKDFPQVEELWTKVCDFVSKRRGDTKWKNILNDLVNRCEQSAR